MLPLHLVEARADHLEQSTPYYVLCDVIKVRNAELTQLALQSDIALSMLQSADCTAACA